MYHSYLHIIIFHNFFSCKDIRSLGRGSCAECGIHSNLVHCLDCRYNIFSILIFKICFSSIFCDGRGHLSRHLSAHPSHKTLYSYKLDKLVCKTRLTSFWNFFTDEVLQSWLQCSRCVPVIDVFTLSVQKFLSTLLNDNCYVVSFLQLIWSRSIYEGRN